MNKKFFLFFSFIIILSAQNNISQYFKNINGCFVLYDFNNDEYIRYNKERCEQRFLPASTSKIMNSIIFLEENIIPDENFMVKWDSVDRGWDKWNMDHNLRTAIKYSAVWFYQELARRMEREVYQNYLDKFDYGNKTIGDRIDNFWLDWSLQISANEQIEFLKKFVKNELPVSQRSIDITKEILIAEQTDNYVLRAKTGLGDKRDGLYTGWYVGYAEANNNVYVFAMNMEAEDYEKIKTQVRIDLTKNILTELGVLK
ncbi:MAG: class D beta-lactamase [Ignavibacteriales bacterium]|jgi:beta-lactamase class D|nr:MAG: class D beta-lactamase [Ignavibacteriales bacterium]